MGYDSNFNIAILRCKNAEEGRSIIRDIEQKSGYSLEDKCYNAAALYEAHWYDAVQDIAAVAKKHPDAVIELTREGEDRDDNQKTRFHGSALETVTLKTQWPPFRDVLLDDEKKEPAGKLHIATIVEVDGTGDVFTSIYSGKNPAKVRDDIVRHLETEMHERELKLEFDPEEILSAVIHGNETSGPERIEASNWDTTFYVATAVMEN